MSARTINIRDAEPPRSNSFIINNSLFSWVLNPSTDQLVASLTWDDTTTTFDSDTVTWDTY